MSPIPDKSVERRHIRSLYKALSVLFHAPVLFLPTLLYSLAPPPPLHAPPPPPSPAPLSYKPQKISPKFEGSVRALLHKKIRESYLHPQVRELPEPSDEKAM